MGGEDGGAETLQCWHLTESSDHLRLEGGAADDDGISSSSSLDRLRPLPPPGPLLAADILGRSGELMED